VRSVNIVECKKGEVYLTGDSYGMYVCVSLGQIFDEETYDKPQYVTIFAEMSTGRVYHATGGAYADEAYYLTELEQSEFDTFINKWEIAHEVFNS
jgi:hypothetical protein